VMFVDADASREKEEGAVRVVDHARELCAQAQLADAEFEVVEGDARNVLCEAVDRHAADLLAVGSHGHGAIKRHYSLLLIDLNLCACAFFILDRHASST
jgi:nucleotide-binding universal stress UspA family protein